MIFLTFFHKTYVVAILLELSCVANVNGEGGGGGGVGSQHVTPVMEF